MDGAGTLMIGRPLPPPPAAGNPPAPPKVLDVRGTVYLPPVGKNDPLLPSLMAQAFMAGLLQMGQMSSAVNVQFDNLPAKIVKTKDFEYDLKLTRIGIQVVKIKKGLELIVAQQANGDVVLGEVAGLPPELTNNTTVTVKVPHTAFTIDASKVKIRIQLLIGVGTATRVVVAESNEIDVELPIN